MPGQAPVHRPGDREANRELQVLLGQRPDQRVGGAGAIGPDQDRLVPPAVRQLRERPLQHQQVVGGGVAAGVARAQQAGQGLAGVVQPRTERVIAEAALDVALGAFLVRVRRHQRRVQVDHRLVQQPPGRPRTRQLRPDQLAAGQPRPIPGQRSGPPDVGQHRWVDPGQHPPDGRGRGDRPGRPEQALLVGQGLHITDHPGAVSDRHRDVDQHPPRVVPGPAFPQPAGGLRQRGGQADPVRELCQ